VQPIDPVVLARSLRWLRPIAKRYFRAETRGLERVPAGQTILVAHHDGGVMPLNGVCFGVDWYDRFGFERPVYVLAHDFLHSLGRGFAKLLADSGIIRADRGMMDAALRSGASVFVFPGAARETFRSYWQRRDIDLGGRTGFVAQAIRWNIPITPVVSAGSHETVFVLSGGHKLARAIGLPKLIRSADVLPLQLGLPWGLWALPILPQFPLPAKITTEVLAPIRLEEALGKKLRRADADDPAIVKAGFDLVLTRMRTALDRLYDERRWPILG
jgi:1-acyl-sn-glycerol-3-phosphate acyltransferase